MRFYLLILILFTTELVLCGLAWSLTALTLLRIRCSEEAGGRLHVVDISHFCAFLELAL
jgi:predicted MFS family arabinose efflux permease